MDTTGVATEASSLAAPVAMEENKVVAISSSRPLSQGPGQIAMTGKPVATVTPMSTAKSNSNSSNQQPSVPAKPKVSADSVCKQAAWLISVLMCKATRSITNGDKSIGGLAFVFFFLLLLFLFCFVFFVLFCFFFWGGGIKSVRRRGGVVVSMSDFQSNF